MFELGLDRHFDALVFSRDVGMAKPDPGLDACVAEQLGLAPHELLVIGDARRDDARGPRAGGSTHRIWIVTDGGAVCET